MVLELLIPGTQHAEEADLSVQMLGIASHFEQGCCASVEQQVVDDLLVLQGAWRQFPRAGGMPNGQDTGGTNLLNQIPASWLKY